MKFPIFPEQASNVAAQTDYLYFALTCLSALMILIIFIPMIYFLFKYRRGKPANRRPIQLPTHTIEITYRYPHALDDGPFCLGREPIFHHRAATAKRERNQRRRQAVDVEDSASRRKPRDQ